MKGFRDTATRALWDGQPCELVTLFYICQSVSSSLDKNPFLREISRWCYSLNGIKMQEATHTRLTEKDRLRRDKTLMDRLLIFHKPESTSDAWPEHLRNTFQTVQNLRNFRYESYDDDVLPQHSTSAWRLDTKLRAKELSDVACRLLNENPTELKWRLETEGFIDARFRKNTTWCVLQT